MNEIATFIGGIFFAIGSFFAPQSFGTTKVFPFGGGTGTGEVPTYGQVLAGTSGGIYATRATSTLGVAISDTTGTLSVARGGTGRTSIASSTVIIGNVSGGFSQYATSSLGILGTPAGSDTYIQYNNAGVFGGSSSLTYNSGTTLLTVPTISVSLIRGTSGDLGIRPASSADRVYIADGTNGSLTAQLVVTSLTTGRAFTFPDANGTFCLTATCVSGGRDWSMTTNFFGQASLAPTTTQNIAISGTGTSTFKGGLEAWTQIGSPYFHATSTTATSTFAGHILDSGNLKLVGNLIGSSNNAITLPTWPGILLLNNGTKPTVTGCGTATITATSTDTRGTISVTAGTPASCNLTFSSAKSDTPTCVASTNSVTLLSDVALASTTGVQFGLSAVFAGNIFYVCLQ